MEELLLLEKYLIFVLSLKGISKLSKGRCANTSLRSFIRVLILFFFLSLKTEIISFSLFSLSKESFVLSSSALHCFLCPYFGSKSFFGVTCDAYLLIIVLFELCHGNDESLYGAFSMMNLLYDNSITIT